MNLFLVENYQDDNIKNLYDLNTKIIALTPKACSDLEDNNFHYDIPEDYFLWRQDQDYWDWFDKWLDILEYYHFKNTKLAHECVAPLHSIMNNFIGRALTYKAIFTNKKYDCIYFFTGQQTFKKIIPDVGTFKGKSIFDQLLMTSWLANPKTIFYSMSQDKVYERLTPRIIDNPNIRPILDYIRCLQFIPAWKDKKIVFVNRIPKEIRDAKLKGYQVEVLNSNRFIEKNKNEGIHIALYKSIEDMYGIPVNVCMNVLDPILENYINSFMPETLAYKEYFKTKFKRDVPNCVIFRHKTLPYHCGAFLASKELGLTTIYIRHGWDAFYDPITYKIRRGGYKYFVNPTIDSLEYIAKHATEGTIYI